MTEWKRTHNEQYNATKRNLRTIWPEHVTERWAYEFERALEERGAVAKAEHEARYPNG